MNWEDFIRASTDYKQNRTIVKQYFSQLGPISPSYRLLVWAEMIPMHHKDLGYGQEALLSNLSIKVRKQKVIEIYHYLFNTFKYEIHKVESEPHTEGDDSDVQQYKYLYPYILKAKVHELETFYGEAQVIKRFLMTELQHQDKCKQMIVESYMSELLEGFFMDLQGSQKSPQLVVNILENFFLFGLEFICLLIKAIIQDFEVIFDRQSKELDEHLKKQSKPISNLITAQIDLITAEIYHLQIEDPNIIPRSIQNIQHVILSAVNKKAPLNTNTSSSNGKQTLSNSKLTKHSPSKSTLSKPGSSTKTTTRTQVTKQDDLESTGNFNVKSNVKVDTSPSKPRIGATSRRNSLSTQEYQTPNKLKATPEQKSPIQSVPLQTQVNKVEDFNTEMMRLVGKYGTNRLESHFSKSKAKEVAGIRHQVLELQKKAIDMGKMCQEILFQIDHMGDKEN